MNYNILLPSSDIFDNFTLLDEVHQSFIDLKNKPSEEYIQHLIQKSIEQISKDSYSLITNELFYLIETCFENYPNQSIDFINDILNKSRSSSNFIIISSIIFSTFHSDSIYKNFKSFIRDSFIEMKSFILNKKSKLIIFDHEIPDQFISNFMINILLSTKLNEKSVKLFLPFIFSQKNTSPIKLNKFTNKIAIDGFTSFLPRYISPKNTSCFSFDSLTEMIPRMDDEQFKQIFPWIESTFSKKQTLPKPFISSILYKCIKTKYKLNSSESIVNSLSGSQMKRIVWEYFENNNVVLPQTFTKNLKNYCFPKSAIKIVQDFEKIPTETLSQGILKSNDLDSIKKILDSESAYLFPSGFFADSKFWIHVFNVAASKEEKVSNDFLDKLVEIFQHFNKEASSLKNIFTEMIFSNFPTTNNGNYFLLKFLEKFDYDFKTSLYQNQNNLIEEITKMGKIPLLSFWKIFNYYYLNTFPKDQTSNPFFLCAYVISKSEYTTNYPFTDFSINFSINSASSVKLIVNFIKGNNLDQVIKLDSQSLSLVINSILFVNSRKNVTINNLNKEIILPFLAICFIYIKSNKGNLNDLTFDISDMILEACNLLPNTNSALLKTSINSIISVDNYNLLVSNDKFPKKTFFEMLDELINSLINYSYTADEFVLLKLVFYLTNKIDYDEDFQNLLIKYKRQILIFIAINMKNIPNFNSLGKFNLSVFGEENIENDINSIVSELSSSSAANFIIFIYKFCTNAPDLTNSTFSDDRFIEILINLFENKNWDDLLMILEIVTYKDFYTEFCQRIKDEKIPIQSNLVKILEKRKLKNVVDRILNEEELEKKDDVFKYLFNALLLDDKIKNTYLEVLLENMCDKNQIKPSLIVAVDEIFSENLKIEILRKNYGYHFKNNTFVHKCQIEKDINIENNIASSFLQKLLKKASMKINDYRLFYLLYYIASVFPFLFNENPKLVFESVLPSFSKLSLLYKYKKKESEEDLLYIKSSVTSIYFLYSTLHSVKMLDYFIPWIFENILSFDQSQVLAFSFILKELFSFQKIKDVLLSLSIKYNFLETIEKLISKKIDEDINYYYIQNFTEIIGQLYSLLNNLSPSSKLIFIDETQKVENPFSLLFNNFITILPKKLQKIDFLPDVDYYSDKIDNFLKDIKETKYGSISLSESDYVTEQDEINFIIHFQEIETVVPDVENMKSTPYFDCNFVNRVRLLSHQQNWVYDSIFNYATFNKLPEHIEYLGDVKVEVDSVSSEGDVKYSDVNINDFHIDKYQNHVFYLGIKLMASYVNDGTFIFDMQDPHNYMKSHKSLQQIISFIGDEFDSISFLNYLNQYFFDQRDKSIEFLNDINNLVFVLFYLISNKIEFKDNFLGICGENLILLVLYHDYRTNSSLLTKTANLFCLFDKDLPLNLTHLVGFMFMLDEQSIIPSALNLCKHIGSDKISNVMKPIKKVFRKEFKMHKPSYYIIDCFLKTLPSLVAEKKSKLPLLLNKLCTNYTNNKSKDECALSLICTLFNILAPERDKNQVIIATDEIDFSLTLTLNSSFRFKMGQEEDESKPIYIKPAPKNLQSSDPKFWGLYENYRSILNEIIEDDQSKLDQLEFLFDYPELINFQTRLSYFHKKMKKKINSNRCTYINVDRNDLLKTSFDQLHNKSNEEWLYKYSVNFNNENGIDAGGLTCEWFTMIVKELLTESNLLFSMSENKSYQPSPSSSNKEDYIEYFKFAGKIIARALIQNQCVNAHLTRSFCRQILRRQVKLRDLEDYDQEIYNSLQNLLEIDVDPLEFNFTIDVKQNGEDKHILLEEDGENKLVTNENKSHYVSLYVNYHLRKSIIDQINAFCEGFNSLVPHEEIRLFSPSELDLVICGIPEIDLDDLRENASFRNPYRKDHPVIEMLFNVLKNWDNENLAKFLLFVTGSSQVPINGFKEYKDAGKPITFADGGENDRLCVAHTCFNTLDLPQYENEEDMNNKLLISIQECEFGLA